VDALFISRELKVKISYLSKHVQNTYVLVFRVFLVNENWASVLKHSRCSITSMLLYHDNTLPSASNLILNIKSWTKFKSQSEIHRVSSYLPTRATTWNLKTNEKDDENIPCDLLSLLWHFIMPRSPDDPLRLRFRVHSCRIRTEVWWPFSAFRQGRLQLFPANSTISPVSTGA
jgi:hypothetical protein